MNGVVLQANILNTVYLRRYLRAWIMLDVTITLAFACIGHSLNQKRRVRLLLVPSIVVSYSVIMLCFFIL